MSTNKTDDAPREEHDFSGGKRGRYAASFAEGSNVVVLDPDIADKFPDSKAVNEALRSLVKAPVDDDDA